MIDPNRKIQLNEGRSITDGNFTFGGFPRILNEAKKAKRDFNKNGRLEDSKTEYLGARDNAIKAAMAQKNLDINESREMRTELEKHLAELSSHGESLHKSNHQNRKEYGEALNAFTKGNYNNANKLISMGANPTAVQKYIAISKNPEYQKYMKQMFKTVDPSMGGIYGND